MTIRSSEIFVLSLALLGFSVWYFFVLPRPVPFEEVQDHKARQVTILLEGAEVAKITEQGKAWTLRSPRIEKRDGEVVLAAVVGTFLSGGAPLYEVRAGAGEVSLETSSVVLEDVELRHVETGERLRGKRLTWEGKAQEFLVEGVSFAGRGFSIRCNALVYNVARRKARFQGNVVVEVEMRNP